MNMAPLKLLVTSYGLAVVAAAAVALRADGALAPLLVFWLGGPVIVFGLATIPGLRDVYRAPADPDEGRDAAPCDARAAVEAFERDRRVDAASSVVAPIRAEG